MQSSAQFQPDNPVDHIILARHHDDRPRMVAPDRPGDIKVIVAAQGQIQHDNVRQIARHRQTDACRINRLGHGKPVPVEATPEKIPDLGGVILDPAALSDAAQTD